MVLDSNKDSCSNTADIGDVTQGPGEEIKYYSSQQEDRTKRFLQAASDWQRRYLQGVEARLIFWLGVIAIIVAASSGMFGLSDGLLIGAVLVALVVAGRTYFWTRLIRKRMDHVDRFRQRFRELLDSVNDIRWQTQPEETVREDKAFLEKYTDSILFPSTVSDARSAEVPSDRELAHIETLYLEYRSWRHLHSWPDPNDPNSNTRLKCELCMAADRVKKNIEGAISAYEAAITSARQEFVARIDGANPEGALDANTFLDEYSKRRALYYVPEDLADQDEKLLAWLNSLCDKQCWTFEDADKIRDLCKIRAKGQSHWLESYEQRDRFDHLVLKMTQEMTNAANRFGLADTWDWYDSAKHKLSVNDAAIKHIRRILQRSNPGAMFRELEEESWHKPWWGDVILPGLTKWGYDGGLLAKECRKARHRMLKERDEADRLRDGQLRAVQAFLRTERRASE